MSENIKSLIIEIRAGVGGEEAALFVADLYRMYTRYAQNKDYKCALLDSHPTEIGGFKEIVFEVKGEGAYEELKSEGGVHRVQRIPQTEKSGRIHTSTVTVAVLAKPTFSQIQINPADLEIETTKASGPGGQYVNKRMTAIRIKHKPSGIVVTSQTERSLQQNKESALSILGARLLQKQEEKQLSAIKGARQEQIGSAQRVEKMRTYNFPQDRVTDHRIGKKWHDIEGMMDGKIDKMIKTLKKAGL